MIIKNLSDLEHVEGSQSWTIAALHALEERLQALEEIPADKQAVKAKAKPETQAEPKAAETPK